MTFIFKSIFILLFFISYSQGASLPKCNGDYRKHCSGSIIHKNGEKYVGEIQNYKYHGKGTYLYANGNVYIGEFREWNSKW